MYEPNYPRADDDPPRTNRRRSSSPESDNHNYDYDDPQRGRRGRDRPQHIVITSTKSTGIAILLTFLFGPLGMLYSTVLGGLVMMGVNLFVLVLAACTGGIAAVLLLITWPICILWGALAVNSYNAKLRM